MMNQMKAEATKLAFRELGPALQKYLANFRKDGVPVSFLYLDVDALDSAFTQHIYGSKESASGGYGVGGGGCGCN